jgi:hypothetical protein
MKKAEIISKLVEKCITNAGAIQMNIQINHPIIVYSGKFDFTDQDDIIQMELVMLTVTGAKFDIYHRKQLLERTEIPFNSLTEETLIRILEIVEPVNPATNGVIYEILKVADWTLPYSENTEYISTGRLFWNFYEAQREADRLTNEETENPLTAYIAKQRTIK